VESLRNGGKSSLGCEWAVWLGKGWGRVVWDHVIDWRCWEDVWLGISFVAIAKFD